MHFSLDANFDGRVSTALVDWVFGSGGQRSVFRKRGPNAGHLYKMRLQIGIGGLDGELLTLRFQAQTFQCMVCGIFEHGHLLTGDASSHADARSSVAYDTQYFGFECRIFESTDIPNCPHAKVGRNRSV
jgi:hypothetical protein